MDKNASAIKYMKENKYEEAATLFHEIINDNPEDPLGYINFGNLLLHLNDYEHAQGFFEKAIDLDGTIATAFYGLGNMFFEQSNYPKAQENFQKAIDLGLEEGDAYYMLGLTFRNQEHMKLALPYLLRATELVPGDDEMLFQYGLTLAQCDYIEDAKSIFEKIVARSPLYADAHYNLGVIELYNDNPTKAMNHFNEALAAQTDHVLAANGKRKVEEMLSEMDGSKTPTE